MILKLLYLMCLLTYCTSVVFGDDLITYSVLSVQILTPDKAMGVLVDGNFFPLQQSSSVPMMYTGSAPKSQTSYQYTVAKAIDKSIIHTEEFQRPPEYLTEEKSFNDVYGQHWHKIEDMHKLPQLYAFDRDESSHVGGMKDPAASNLYEDGTVATIHINASPEEIQEMHAKKMDKKVNLRATLTYIK